MVVTIGLWLPLPSPRPQNKPTGSRVAGERRSEARRVDIAGALLGGTALAALIFGC
jgi:hypothetical protein